ncbi:MAG: methyltransferase, partial [Nitrososphaerales archaeon]
MSPRERVNTSALGVTVAYLVMAFVLLLVSATVSPRLGLPIVETLPLLFLGLALVAIGFAFRYLGLEPLLAANRSIQWAHVPGTLVEDGVFRYSRNPAYLGVLLMFLGALLVAVNLPMLIVLAVMFALLNRQASREEDVLTGRFWRTLSRL